MHKKRVYNSESRDTKDLFTKKRILSSARKLFSSEGFENVSIEKLAADADVTTSIIYALFISKRGVLLALVDEALPSDYYLSLIDAVRQEKSVEKRLKIAAKIARQMYDAERAQIDLFRGALVLAPEFKDNERVREERRYIRQEETIKTMAKEKVLIKGLSTEKARDIFWAFTGRDMYRMFVIEQGWSSDDYERWLGELLIKSLIDTAV